LKSGWSAEAKASGLHAPLNFWLLGQLKTLVYSTLMSDLEVLQQVENACPEIRFKKEFSVEFSPLCYEKLEVLLKCEDITESMVCRNQTDVDNVSADADFWTYIY
jgi:hypothetical protein